MASVHYGAKIIAILFLLESGSSICFPNLRCWSCECSSRTLPKISREEFEFIFDELDDSHDFKVSKNWLSFWLIVLLFLLLISFLFDGLSSSPVHMLVVWFHIWGTSTFFSPGSL